MTRLSRRQWLAQGIGWTAAALSLDAAVAGPLKRDKKHGRGHPHHHQVFEQAGTAPDCLNALAMAKGLAFGCCLGTGTRKTGAAPGLKELETTPSGYDDPQMRALLVAQCSIMVPGK